MRWCRLRQLRGGKPLRRSTSPEQTAPQARQRIPPSRLHQSLPSAAALARRWIHSDARAPRLARMTAPVERHSSMQNRCCGCRPRQATARPPMCVLPKRIARSIRIARPVQRLPVPASLAAAMRCAACRHSSIAPPDRPWHLGIRRVAGARRSCSHELHEVRRGENRSRKKRIIGGNEEGVRRGRVIYLALQLRQRLAVVPIAGVATHVARERAPLGVLKHAAVRK